MSLGSGPPFGGEPDVSPTGQQVQEGSIGGEIEICAICAWRAASRCPDFARDVNVREKAEKEEKEEGKKG